MSVQVWVLSSHDTSKACCSGEGDHNTNTNTFVVWVVDNTVFVKMTGLIHTVGRRDLLETNSWQGSARISIFNSTSSTNHILLPNS